MRFNEKPYKKGMKLTDKPNDRWARDAAEAAKNVPILTRPLKGSPTYHISVRGSAALQGILEQVRDSSDRFKCMSDVYRAVMYAGAHLIYEGISNEIDDSHMLHNLFDLMRKTERMHQWMIGIDHVVDMVRKFKQYQETGFVSREERNEFLDQVMAALPAEVWPMAKDKINRVLTGENATDLYECQYDNKTADQ